MDSVIQRKMREAEEESLNGHYTIDELIAL